MQRKTLFCVERVQELKVICKTKYKPFISLSIILCRNRFERNTQKERKRGRVHLIIEQNRASLMGGREA